MVVELPDGTEQPLLDIWLWGRVRSVSELSSTDLDGSVAVLAALAMAAALAVAVAVLWLRRSRDRARGGCRALFLMVIVLVRRRGGRDESSGEPGSD
jgi:hypothetical protein